jgi:Lipocalin-like domain
VIENMKPRLLGTWRLVSAEREIVATGQTEAQFPEGSSGFIMYAPDDRMMVLITGPGRKTAATDAERADLQTTMLAYAGRYSIEPAAVVHHIDVAWNPALVGAAQRRFVTFEGNCLILRGAPGPSAIDGVFAQATITWEKVA